MKTRSKVISLILITGLILIGCKATLLLVPTESDVERGKSKYPDYTLTQLSQGKLLYEQNCQSCHNLKKPTSRTEEEWKAIVPNMSKQVNKTSMVLKNTEQELILRYLVTMGLTKK